MLQHSPGPAATLTRPGCNTGPSRLQHCAGPAATRGGKTTTATNISHLKMSVSTWPGLAHAAHTGTQKQPEGQQNPPDTTDEPRHSEARRSLDHQQPPPHLLPSNRNQAQPTGPDCYSEARRAPQAHTSKTRYCMYHNGRVGKTPQFLKPRTVRREVAHPARLRTDLTKTRGYRTNTIRFIRKLAKSICDCSSPLANRDRWAAHGWPSTLHFPHTPLPEFEPSCSSSPLFQTNYGI